MPAEVRRQFERLKLNDFSGLNRRTICGMALEEIDAEIDQMRAEWDRDEHRR